MHKKWSIIKWHKWLWSLRSIKIHKCQDKHHILVTCASFNGDLPEIGRAGVVTGADGVLNGFGPAKFDGAC